MEVYYCSICKRNIPAINQFVHQARCKPEAVCANSALPEVIDLSADSQASSSAAPAQLPTEWQCSKCTYFNSIENVVCEMCEYAGDREEKDFLMNIPEEMLNSEEASFPSASNISQSSSDFDPHTYSWNGAGCTFVNPIGADACAMCGTVRPASSSYSEQLIPDFADFVALPRTMHTSSFVPFRQTTRSSRGGRGSGGSSSTMAGATLLGAGLGAGLAWLNDRPIGQGALEGAGVGAIGGLLMQTLEAMRPFDDQPPDPDFNAHDSLLEEMALRMAAAMGGLEVLPPNAPRGVDPETIRNLPTRTFQPSSSSSDGNNTKTDDKCSICLCQYEAGEEVKMLPCLHSYHGQCIDRWLQQSKACPVCKHNIH